MQHDNEQQPQTGDPFSQWANGETVVQDTEPPKKKIKKGASVVTKKNDEVNPFMQWANPEKKNGTEKPTNGLPQPTSQLPLQEDNQLDFNFINRSGESTIQTNDDPVGSEVGQIQSQKQSILNRNISSDATHVFHDRNINLETGKPIKSEDEQTLDNLNNQINNIKENTFTDAQNAQQYLKQKLVGKKLVKKNDVFQQPQIVTPNSNINDFDLQSVKGNIDKSNATERLAFDKIQKEENLNDAISTSQSLNEAAIKFSASQDPTIKKQVDYLQSHGEKLPDAYEGALVADFLNKPDVIKRAQSNPDFLKQYQETQRNLLIQYPEFGKKIVAQKISQAREDAGLNNAIANIPTQESTDKVVQDMYDAGKLNAIEKSVYENKIRPSLGILKSIGRGIGRLIPGVQAVVGESQIATPGLFENFENTYVNTLHGMAKSIEDLPLSKDYGTDSQKLAASLQKDYSGISINPVGTWHELGQETGNLTGFVLPMIMGGAATKAIGASEIAGANITNYLMFEGNNKDASLKMFPDNSAKQFLYTTLATAGDMMIGKLIPTHDAQKGVANLFKDDISKVVNDFTEGNITAAAAKSTLLNKASEFIPKVVKGNLNMGATMAGFGLFHNGLDAAFGGRDVSGEEVANEALQGFKSGFFGGTIISAMAANSGNAKLNGKVIREMANNREHYENVLNDQSKLNPELKPDNDLKIANLNEAAIINKDLENTNLSDPQKEKYLIQGLSQKVWERKAENANNSVLKDSYLAKAEENKANQIKILEGIDKAAEHTNFTETIVEEKPTEPIVDTNAPLIEKNIERTAEQETELLTKELDGNMNIKKVDVIDPLTEKPLVTDKGKPIRSRDAIDLMRDRHSTLTDLIKCLT